MWRRRSGSGGRGGRGGRGERGLPRAGGRLRPPHLRRQRATRAVARRAGDVELRPGSGRAHGRGAHALRADIRVGAPRERLQPRHAVPPLPRCAARRGRRGLRGRARPVLRAPRRPFPALGRCALRRASHPSGDLARVGRRRLPLARPVTLHAPERRRDRRVGRKPPVAKKRVSGTPQPRLARVARVVAIQVGGAGPDAPALAVLAPDATTACQCAVPPCHCRPLRGLRALLG